jgi:uncharacterized protein YjbI with pentapeptide repeats
VSEVPLRDSLEVHCHTVGFSSSSLISNLSKTNFSKSNLSKTNLSKAPTSQKAINYYLRTAQGSLNVLPGPRSTPSEEGTASFF